MIKEFADNRTAALFRGEYVKKPGDRGLQRNTRKRLLQIDAAVRVEDLRNPPSNNLEKKAGDLTDHYCIWVNKQWRICFKWIDGDAYGVMFQDYH